MTIKWRPKSGIKVENCEVKFTKIVFALVFDLEKTINRF